MSHICFLADTNSMCQVFNTSTLIETIMSFQEFQAQFNPSNSFNNPNELNRCIIKSNLEEYNNEKDELILINSYNKFINETARLELDLHMPMPSNTFVNCIEQCKQKYPMSTYARSK